MIQGTVVPDPLLDALAAIGSPDDTREPEALLDALTGTLDTIEHARQQRDADKAKAEWWPSVAQARDDFLSGTSGAPVLRTKIDEARAALGIHEPGVRVLSPQDAATPHPPWRYPVDGFPLRPGPVCIVSAFSNTGKSIIFQDMMLALAFGRKAWGQFPCSEERVLHLDYEQGEEETLDRYQRLARGSGLPSERGEIVQRITIALGNRAAPRGAPLFFTMPEGRRAIVSPVSFARLRRLLDGHRVALIDSFAASCPGLDEIDSAAGEPIYELGRASEDTGCAIILLHHVAKSGLGKDAASRDLRTMFRGNGAIVGAAGSGYVIGGGKGAPKLVQQAKARSLADPFVDDFCLELTAVDRRPAGYHNPIHPADMGGFAVRYLTTQQASARAEDTERMREEALLAFVKATPGCGVEAARNGARKRGAKGGNDAYSKTITSLVNCRRLCRLGGENGAQLYLPDHPTVRSLGAQSLPDGDSSSSERNAEKADERPNTQASKASSPSEKRCPP